MNIEHRTSDSKRRFKKDEETNIASYQSTPSGTNVTLLGKPKFITLADALCGPYPDTIQNFLKYMIYPITFINPEI